MKKLVLYFIVCLTIVGISGCEILLGPNTPLGKGTLSIGFGDGGGGRSARSLIDDETLAALRYDLVLSGPDNQTITVSLTAGKNFREQVSLGEWRIEARAYLDKDAISVLFGEGMTTVRVRAGTNEAEVPMTVVVPEDTPVSAFNLTEFVRTPVNGATPDTTPIATEEYTGSIAWEEEGGTPFNGNSFAEATVYQAVVRLEAKSGFTFDGLDADSFSYDAPGVTVTNEAGSGNAITVKIVFPVTGTATPTEYTVIFKLNNGTEAVHAVKTVTAPITTVTDFPANPSRNGYIFDSWNTAPDGSGTGFTTATTVDSDRTVYAQWTANSYTVIFKLNDGTETVHATKTVTAPATTVTDFPNNPSRSGYIFDSWNTASDGSGTGFTTATTVSSDRTVYAKWTANSYGISLSPTGPVTFPAANEGYGAQAARTITVNNTGNQATGELTAGLSGADSGSFELNKTTINSIGVSGNNSFTVVPKTSLAAGTYTATVTVSSATYTSISANFTVSFTVNDITLPANVTSLSGTPGNGQVTLTWIDPADADLDRVEITFVPVVGGISQPISVNKGTLTKTITGLTNGTAYTFTVKAVDTAGNKSGGVSSAVMPLAPSGVVTVEFTGLPQDEDFTLTGENILSWAANTTLNASVSETFVAYRWDLDGAAISGETGSSLTLYAGDLAVKQHTLTVFVTKNGVEYTKRVTFTVAQ
jgi:uncharacterized repeat protein (TIGR02543 family)